MARYRPLVQRPLSTESEGKKRGDLKGGGNQLSEHTREKREGDDALSELEEVGIDLRFED